MWKQKCKELLQDDQIKKLRLVDALNIVTFLIYLKF